MRSESIVNDTFSLKEKKSELSGWYRQSIFRWLDSLVVGHLTIVEGEEVYNFGDQHAEISARVHIKNPECYRDVILNGTVGAGESYMKGHWSSPDLVNLVRLMVLNLQQLNNLNANKNIVKKAVAWLYSLYTKNSLKNSRKNISAHYDLGNDFFSLFLDPSMMYSSAIFEHADTPLEDASIAKLEAICKKLQLTEADHVIEIGTGWGGFAVYAAEHYGCKVTTTTISKEQFDYAVAQVTEKGLTDKVTVLFKDYRELEGSYDKLVSIEMIEAVGHKYLKGFFQICNRLLKEDGLMLIQAITISDQRYHVARKNVDFIQRYIFPGGCLPCNTIIAQHTAEDTSMQLVDIHDITYDYALTLKHWRERFFEKIDRVKAQGYNDVFIRMWDYYLCYCEGGFLERVIQTSQFVMAKPQAKYCWQTHRGSLGHEKRSVV